MAVGGAAPQAGIPTLLPEVQLPSAGGAGVLECYIACPAPSEPKGLFLASTLFPALGI